MKAVFKRNFPYSGLPVPIYVLFFSRVVNRMGDFVHFFLTLYLTKRMGLEEAAAGTIIAVSIFASMAGNLISGKLSDHLGRKKILLCSQLSCAVFIGSCGFIPESAAVPWLLVASQFFNGAARPAGASIVIDLSLPEQRQRAISLMYLGINLGVAVGPIIAGFLFNNHLRWIFWGDALTTLIAVVLVASLVPETIPDETAHAGASGNESAESGSVLASLLKRPSLTIFLGLSVLVSFVYRQCAFTLPLQLAEIYPGEGPGYYGMLMSINAVTVLVLTPLLLKILEKRSPLKNLQIAGACYAAGFGMLFFIPSVLYWYIMSTIIWTTGEIIMVTNEGVYVAAHTPVNQRGRINGVVRMLHGAGGAATPVLSGVLIESAGIRSVWPVSAALCLVYLSVMMLLKRAEARR